MIEAMTRSIAIVLILCAICVGCGESDPPGRKIYRSADGTVYDYPIDVDTIRIPNKVAYVTAGDQIFRVYPRMVTCYTDDTLGPRPWVDVDVNNLYPDSLSACLALKSRYEKQAKELEEKMKGVCK